jgi:nucleotide-binding universal stress UspA family protein
MSYKTILVHCDAGKAADARLSAAVELAGRHQAHLVGLHAKPPFEPPVYGDASYALDRFYEAHEATMKTSEDASRTLFEKATRGTGLSAEWRSADGYADQLLTLHARYADLTIVGQTDPDRDDLPPPSDLPESVALATGRGTLIVPFIATPKMPMGKVMLCWNGSREAARAASDALPLLRAATHVTVLSIEPKSSADSGGSHAGADIATWLGRHGVTATVQRDTAPDADAGEVILSRAMDYGSELIVMGIYGHSRLREFVLGGASRTILASMTVPVFMAH